MNPRQDNLIIVESIIVLSLAHSPAPGVQWEYEVRFEATATGHRVSVKDPNNGRLRTLRRSRKALTWRAALADLVALEETWLRGDLRAALEVSGVSGWQADVLRLAACRIEDSPPLEAELLVQLSDEAIERFAERWGSFIVEPALAVVRSLVEMHAETGAVSVIQDHLLRSTPSDGTAPDAWLESVRQRCEANPGPGPSLAAARALRDAPAFLALAEGPPPRNPAVRALLFQKWVELVLPVTFERTSWKLGDQPELIAAEWVVSECAKPGELMDAAASNPGLRLAVDRFRAAVEAFTQEVVSKTAATSYAAGIGLQLMHRASRKAEEIRYQVIGDAGVT